jgi:DNA adenine methylase
VILEVCPFQECERYIGAGDFVYCDPPYAPLSRTAHFTGYAKEEFTAEHQRALRDLLRRISPHCQWMLSNSAAPLIDELYTAPEFHIYSVLAGRAINSASERRGKIEERVITNYDPAARDSAMTGETIAFTQEKLLQ